MIPEERAPYKTYLRLASLEKVFSFKYPASTNDIIDTISIEIYRIIKSTAETIKNKPNVIIPNKVKNSPFLYFVSSSEYKLTIETRIVAKIMVCLKKDEKGSNTTASVKSDVVILPCFQIENDTISSPKLSSQPVFPDFDLSISKS